VSSATCSEPLATVYLRIPPAAPAEETPLVITETEFDAALAADTFTRDQYAYIVPGAAPWTADDLRVQRARHARPRPRPSPALAAAVAAVQAEWVPLGRLLALVRAGLDDPAHLTEALARFQAATRPLAALVDAAASDPRLPASPGGGF
jgi:hypothetical protein